MPSFFEAIDNRAFMYMELGQPEPALTDFQQSLRVNPGGNAAFFSRGECLLKLGRYEEAEQVFMEGMQRFPEHLTQYREFLELTRAARKHRPNGFGAPAATPAPHAPAPAASASDHADGPNGKSPWWRFWR